jgi:hypothetical protein
MAATANGYVPDQGEVAVTISAGNVSAVGAPFVTAETIVIDGAVRSFRRTNNPPRPMESTRVSGSTTPIITVGNTVPHEEWELVLVDDWYGGITAGEWGTDTLAAVEIFQEMYDHRSDPGGISVTPAGGAAGDVEITLVNPKIISISRPEVDADRTRLNEVTVVLGAAHSTTATWS